MMGDWDRSATERERLMRLEVVVQHLSASSREHSGRIESQSNGLGRAFRRLDEQDRSITAIRDQMAALRDVPAWIAMERQRRTDRMKAKLEAREMRRRAMDTITWGVTLLLGLLYLTGMIDGEKFDRLKSLPLPSVSAPAK